jgi:preprotein translocase subunit SecF
MIKFLKYSKFYFIFSGLLVIASIVFISIWGLKFGVDFTGGSLLEVEFTGKRPAVSQLREKVKNNLDIDFSLQETGAKGIMVRAKSISEEQHQRIISSFGENKVIEKRFEMIGSVVGNELKRSTIIAIIVAAFLITIYVAAAFRKISRPIPSWQYGIAAILALLHDVLITTGLFAVLGKFGGVEVNVPFVAAILTILGYSVSDTIIIFDRCRENLIKNRGDDFQEVIDKSLNETLIRSIFTAFTTLLPLFAMLFFGGETLFAFVLALTVGIIIGSYSSIFIAPPTIFYWAKLKNKEI